MGEAESQRFGDLLKLATRESPFSGEGFSTENKEWNFLKLLVVGAGGLGCELLHCLALSGFTDIHCIDMDTINRSNLYHQFLFRNDDIGKPKADVAAAFINKRCPWVTVTPQVGRVQEQQDDFFRGFHIVIMAVASINVRAWINQKLASLVEYEMVDDKLEAVPGTAIPLIDGGTEGFKGSSRVILFGKTACINCTLSLFPNRKFESMDVLARRPHTAQHFLKYVLECTWWQESAFQSAQGETLKPDISNPDHVEWIMVQAQRRQSKFGMQTSFTIDFPTTVSEMDTFFFFSSRKTPHSSKALIAGMCVNEALKMATGMAKNMDCFASYDGSNAGVASSVNVMLPDSDCLVCQPCVIRLPSISYTPQDVINLVFENFEKQIADLVPGFHHLNPKCPPKFFEAQLHADLGCVRVPLCLLGPLASTTEDAMTAPMHDTLAAVFNKELLLDQRLRSGSTVRLELSGGLLKSATFAVVAILDYAIPEQEERQSSNEKVNTLQVVELAALPSQRKSIKQALYFLGKEQKGLLERKAKAGDPRWSRLTEAVLPENKLPCFVPASVVAIACGFDTKGIDAAEAKFGVYIWGTEFENVHSTWDFVEPGFDFGGIHWNGSEQLFQAQKLGAVTSAPFKQGAASFASCDPLGSYSRGRACPLRSDWDNVKDDAMRLALAQKFGQSASLTSLLLATNGFPLVSVKADAYWGAGGHGCGENKLGLLLMELRESMKPET